MTQALKGVSHLIIIENEENLIKLNEEKLNINKEISNLEIYKKYLKKIKG